MHRVDVVGNSLGVGRELTKGIKSLPGWRKGVRQKKTKTHRKIVGGSRKACRERLAVRMLEAVGLAGGLVFTQRRSVVDAGVP
ncbi:hypothetical protein BHM03_00028644 [Ensete ventricosum]|nr:hypothetical protein BHM03_00028644 [Ensete ventricosum]